MNAEELRGLKHDLENETSACVSKLVEDFKEQSGFSPQAIDIQMVNVRDVGDYETSTVVGRISVEVKI